MLNQYMRERGYSLERLAQESGVAKQTLHNWLKENGIRRPHSWQSLVRVAVTLQLDKAEVTALLKAAEHPGIDELITHNANKRDIELLDRWITSGPNNLPSDLTSFIGRVEEIGRATQLLKKARLVTLTGPGGTGKTRLALHVARNLLETYRDGVFFVDLVSTTDPSLVLTTVAQTLGLRSTTSEPVHERLKTYLRQRQMLLVLDNFEHVILAGPQIVALLKAAPNLTILTTSRELLHVSGEHDFPVPPLPLPVVNESFDRLSQNTAITLFAERAQAVNISFTLTSNNIKQVAEICQRLDGLPLAIELAAARTKHFSPQALLLNFGTRLSLANNGPQDVPTRHQSLWWLIGWSYDLLNKAEQTLFRRLAVFVGGWTADAARNVVNINVNHDHDIVSVITSLVEQNLVRGHKGADGEIRYGMLETIREYAHEQLANHAEAEVLQKQHAVYYLELAENAVIVLAGLEQANWVERLKAELDNFRAALRWTIAQGQAEFALRLGAALGHFWNRRGYVHEGRQWLDQALALPYFGPLRFRAAALASAGMLAHSQNDFAAELSFYNECLAIYRRVDDRVGVAHTIGRLGLLAQARRHYPQAKQLLQESLDLHRQLGDKDGIAFALHFLAVILLVEGDLNQSLPLAKESVKLYRELGDTARIASSISLLGMIALYEGDHERAKRWLQEGLELHRAVDETLGVSNVLMQLGFVALAKDDIEGARSYFRESLALQPGIQDQLVIGYCLDGLTEVAARGGQPERAARLAAAAHAQRERLGLIVQPVDRKRYDDMIAAVRAELGPRAWEVEWAWGQTHRLDQVITEALEKV